MLEVLITAGLITVVSVAMAVSTPDSPPSDTASGKSAASGGAAHGHEATPGSGATQSSPGTRPNSPTTPAVSKGTLVNVSLTDLGGPQGMGSGGYSPDAMKLSADHVTVPHGAVTFHVKNAGDIDHEMLVLPLEDAQPIGARPFNDKAKIDDSARLHEESHAEPNTSVSVTLTLSPGRYELVCNHPGHYVSGMYTQLTVT